MTETMRNLQAALDTMRPLAERVAAGEAVPNAQGVVEHWCETYDLLRQCERAAEWN